MPILPLTLAAVGLLLTLILLVRLHAALALVITSMALGLAAEHVNVKATTGEGMGFVGRQEGVAALAVASLRIR